jgi:hypothetical protein
MSGEEPMANRKGAKEFATDNLATRPNDTVSSNMDPTRVDGVYAGLEEGEGDAALFHRIVTDVFRIGRHPDSNLVIKADTKVSRHHATILLKDVAYVLQDNGSSNGTSFNGKKIKAPHELMVGDRIKIGKREFVFSRRTEG